MSAPEFKAGQHGEAGRGVEYRVVSGKKGPQDLRLDIRVGGGDWVSAPMGLGFLMHDFFFQNESKQYAQDYRFQGGAKYVNACLEAVRDGWRKPYSTLMADRERKRRRDDRFAA